MVTTIRPPNSLAIPFVTVPFVDGRGIGDDVKALKWLELPGARKQTVSF